MGWETAADGTTVTVRTAAGTYRADRLVICPGAYAPGLLGGMELPLKVERQVQTWFQPDGGVAPFLPDRHPVWMWEPDDDTEVAGFHGFVYGLPAIDGPDGGVKMSIVVQPDPCTPDTIDRAVRRTPSPPQPGHRGRRLLGPRLQVRPRHRRGPGRPGAGGEDQPPDRPLRSPATAVTGRRERRVGQRGFRRPPPG